MARYRYKGDWQPWYECRVVDISRLGIRVEVADTVPADVMGQPITVEVQAPVGAQQSVQLAGRVRSVVENPEGSLHLGVEFVNLSDSEKAMLDAFESILPVAW